MTEERLPSNEGGNRQNNRLLDLNRASKKAQTTFARIEVVLAGRIIAAQPFLSNDDLSHAREFALLSSTRSDHRSLLSKRSAGFLMTQD